MRTVIVMHDNGADRLDEVGILSAIEYQAAAENDTGGVDDKWMVAAARAHHTPAACNRDSGRGGRESAHCM